MILRYAAYTKGVRPVYVKCWFHLINRSRKLNSGLSLSFVSSHLQHFMPNGTVYGISTFSAFFIYCTLCLLSTIGNRIWTRVKRTNRITHWKYRSIEGDEKRSEQKCQRQTIKSIHSNVEWLRIWRSFSFCPFNLIDCLIYFTLIHELNKE